MRTKGKYNKDAHLFISETGQETKSFMFDELACACELNGIKFAKYDGDPQRTSYARYAEKDENGLVIPFDKQNAITGCRAFNIETDSLDVIDALRAQTDIILIDLPARAIEKILNMFGNIDSFYDSFEINEANLTFDIPIASPKSFNTIKALYTSLEGVYLSNKVTFNLVRNVGYSKFLKNLPVVDELYQSNTYIQEMRNNPNVILNEVVQKTMFDDKGFMTEALEGRKLSEVIAMQPNSFHGAVPVILSSMKRDVNELYNKLIA